MERLQRLTKNTLLAFVLISIGFALGKHSVRRAIVPEDAGMHAGSQPTATPTQPVFVRVYYLHATFRCVTCNTIEKMTRELLGQQFAAELADGRIEWREDDFQANEALAKQFDVIASCVVVAQVRGGIVDAYNRLDETWTRMEDPADFNAYVGGAIRAYLPGAGKRGTP